MTHTIITISVPSSTMRMAEAICAKQEKLGLAPIRIEYLLECAALRGMIAYLNYAHHILGCSFADD